MDFTFILTQQDLTIIFNALGELKLKDGVATFGKLSMQQQAQMPKPDDAGGHLPIAQ